MSLFCKIFTDPEIKSCSKHKIVADSHYYKIIRPIILLTVDIGAAFTNYTIYYRAV